MCRLVLCKGPAVPISKIVLEPPHSLFKQSYDAKEMLSGSMNADGYGIGWYNPPLGTTPALYTQTQPIWHDANLPRMMDKISSGIILAHVRGASDGMPVTTTNTHPFAYKNFLFMHNGSIDHFRATIFSELAPNIHTALWDHIKGNTDSEHVFGLWLSYLDAPNKERCTLSEQVQALRKTISFLEALAGRKKIDAVLNLGISDGINVMATRYHFGKRKASLYYIENAATFPASTIIASEKLDDDTNWKPVPERSIVTIDEKNTLTILPF